MAEGPGRMAEGRAGGAWYVGLDAGTQGVKCGVWELGVDGCPRAVGRGAAALAAPARPREGAAEQEPASWLRAAQAAVRGALAEAGPPEAARRVVALGVSGQQHGLVAVDALGRPVRACKLVRARARPVIPPLPARLLQAAALPLRRGCGG